MIEEDDTLSKETRILQRILEAHAFLGENGIDIQQPEVDQTAVRDIDSFDFKALRLRTERHNFIQVSNNAAAEVREFPADNTSTNDF